MADDPPRRMIQLRDGARQFSFRIAGAAIEDGFVLLQKSSLDDFWTLPGGRAELGEDTRETLAREMVEEIGCVAEIGPLLYAAENMFEYEGVACQELLFVYAMGLPPEFPRDRHVVVAQCDEDRYVIDFQWFENREECLRAANVMPGFLIDGLAAGPKGTRHLIWRDPV